MGFTSNATSSTSTSATVTLVAPGVNSAVRIMWIAGYSSGAQPLISVTENGGTVIAQYGASSSFEASSPKNFGPTGIICKKNDAPKVSITVTTSSTNYIAVGYTFVTA